MVLHFTAHHRTTRLSTSRHNTNLWRYSVLLTPVITIVSGCASTNDAQTTFQQPQIQYIEVPIAQPPPQETRELVTGKATKKKQQRTVKAQTVDAVTLYPYTENRIYKIATSPGYFTSIILEPGEQMPGKVALGDPDPMDWLAEKTVAGSGSGTTTVILIKPGKTGLSTNVFVATNRRTYQFDVASYAKRAMDQVKFSFPQRDSQQQLSYQQPSYQPSSVEFSPASFYRNFTIAVTSGDKPRWVPQEVFEISGKTYIGFPQGIGQITAPALFVVENNGMTIPVAFRVKDNRFYEVDRMFANAELRQGDTVVSIRRNGA